MWPGFHVQSIFIVIISEFFTILRTKSPGINYKFNKKERKKRKEIIFTNLANSMDQLEIHQAQE